MIFIILSALFILYTKNPLHAVLGLILVFINSAIFLVSLNINFLALVYVILYVGAICVLFLFVIMLLNLREYDGREIKASKKEFLPFFFAILLYILLYINTVVNTVNIDLSTVNLTVITTDFHVATTITSYILQNVMIFILLTLILFLAIISPIVLAGKHISRSKQDVFYAIVTSNDIKKILIKVK